MKKADRRTQRTSAKLRQALVELILEEGYESISIRDITERAHVGYATFFRHYEGKEALLADAFNQSIDELKQLLFSLGETKPEVEGRIIFEHIKEHKTLYQVFLHGEATLSLLEEVKRGAVKELVMRYARYTSTIPTGILANHVVSSVMALIKWWLHNDMPFEPEQMGKFYAELIMKPVRQLFRNWPLPSEEA